MNVRWSGIALRHLSDIRSYISESNPENAKRFIRSLYNSVSSQLEIFPKSGYVIRKFPDKEHREVIYKKGYRIVYSLTNDQVMILTVRSTYQNFS